MGRPSTLKNMRVRKVSLDMNTSGAWRGLGVFDLDKCDLDGVLDAAETLVSNQTTTGKLRVTLADSCKLPLMYWDQKTGRWEESRHAQG
jgi:hypothetical protein